LQLSSCTATAAQEKQQVLFEPAKESPKTQQRTAKIDRIPTAKKLQHTAAPNNGQHRSNLNRESIQVVSQSFHQTQSKLESMCNIVDYL